MPEIDATGDLVNSRWSVLSACCARATGCFRKMGFLPRFSAVRGVAHRLADTGVLILIQNALVKRQAT